jgi:hypothetical protein
VDVREEVEHAFPGEKVHITVELPLMCRFIQLKRLPDELGSHEETNYHSDRKLKTVVHHSPNG